LDQETGEYVDKFPTPDGGGIHGIEWDQGFIWITAFNPKAIYKVDAETYEIVSRFLCFSFFQFLVEIVFIF
jgi:streptogramin lyase